MTPWSFQDAATISSARLHIDRLGIPLIPRDKGDNEKILLHVRAGMDWLWLRGCWPYMWPNLKTHVFFFGSRPKTRSDKLLEVKLILEIDMYVSSSDQDSSTHLSCCETDWGECNCKTLVCAKDSLTTRRRWGFDYWNEQEIEIYK